MDTFTEVLSKHTDLRNVGRSLAIDVERSLTQTWGRDQKEYNAKYMSLIRNLKRNEAKTFFKHYSANNVNKGFDSIASFLAIMS